MSVSRQTPVHALHLMGLLAGLCLTGPAAAQLLTMPPPAPAKPPAAAPAPAPAPAAPAAPAASGSLFGAPAPAAGFQQAPQQAPGSLFAAPATSAAPPPPASMFNSGPGPAARPTETPSVCETQMTKFQERRQSQMAELDKIVKASKNGKVDPTASCPRLRSLVSVETEMRNWMTKQQATCGIPDEIMGQMRDATSKTAQIAERACQAAADMKRQQTGAPAGGAAPAMKLPAGPL